MILLTISETLIGADGFNVLDVTQLILNIASICALIYSVLLKSKLKEENSLPSDIVSKQTTSYTRTTSQTTTYDRGVDDSTAKVIAVIAIVFAIILYAHFGKYYLFIITLLLTINVFLSVKNKKFVSLLLMVINSILATVIQLAQPPLLKQFWNDISTIKINDFSSNNNLITNVLNFIGNTISHFIRAETTIKFELIGFIGFIILSIVLLIQNMKKTNKSNLIADFIMLVVLIILVSLSMLEYPNNWLNPIISWFTS